MQKYLTLWITIGFIWLCLVVLNTHVLMNASTQARVDEKTLAGVVPEARIQAYDLSPDGQRIAVFALSGDLIEAPSWIILVRVADSKILRQVRIGTSRQHVQGYAPQVAFAANGSLLLVQDGQTVSVLDAATLTTIRSITADTGSPLRVPAGIVSASQAAIATIAFGTGAPVLNYMDKQPVHVVISELSTGRQLAGWDAEDIPFSISPDGSLLAVSDHSTKGPVIGVAIIEAISGQRIATLSGGYDDQKGTPEKPWARILAKSIGSDQVILTPDANTNQSGRAAGTSIKLVRFKDAQVTQEIDPEKYGPTGELAVSADQKTFVTVSRYIAPGYLTHHRPIPRDSKPELLAFHKQGMFKLENRTPLPPLLTLRAGGKFELADVRVSSDGSVISVAEDYGVTILVRK